jgi:hypothetical protein
MLSSLAIATLTMRFSDRFSACDAFTMRLLIETFRFESEVSVEMLSFCAMCLFICESLRAYVRLSIHLTYGACGQSPSFLTVHPSFLTVHPLFLTLAMRKHLKTNRDYSKKR